MYYLDSILSTNNMTVAINLVLYVYGEVIENVNVIVSTFVTQYMLR